MIYSTRPLQLDRPPWCTWPWPRSLWRRPPLGTGRRWTGLPAWAGAAGWPAPPRSLGAITLPERWPWFLAAVLAAGVIIAIMTPPKAARRRAALKRARRRYQEQVEAIRRRYA